MTGRDLLLAAVFVSCGSINATAADDAELGACDGASACLTEALTGLVDGFTGAAGSDLWGWMLGGSQSAGVDQIKSELDTIESTLTTIENELGPNGPIVMQLQKLQCADDADWIAAGPATDINSWYSRYQDFLTDLKAGATIPLGTISSTNTDVTTLYGWANGVIQGNANVAPNDVLTAMISLNNLTVTSTSTETIADCVLKNGDQPKKGTLDDRPYYTNNVVNIQTYVLNLNAQAMVVLTEAYHIYVYGQCISANQGNPAACSSDDADAVIPNLCPASGSSEYCQEPITIYGKLGSSTSGQFLPFVYGQFKAGGAPLSNESYSLVNGVDEILVRSIESYNQAAGANCPDPATSLCGPTVGGLGGPTMQSVAVGPYDYGTGSGKGVWGPSSSSVFTALLDQGYNGSNNAKVTAAQFLCTMSLTGGEQTTCTQPNDGVGLEKLSNKGVYFPESVNPFGTGTFQCFLDGGLTDNISDQPFCTQANFNTILPKAVVQQDNCGDIVVENSRRAANSVNGRPLGPFGGYYTGLYCDSTKEWLERPGYLLNTRYPESFRWPSISLSTLTCSNGKAPNDPSNENPAGVPSLCGSDFDTWFSSQVPAGPTQMAAVADATVLQAAPNDNNGAYSQLALFDSKHRTVTAFDRDELQAFVDGHGLEIAQLVMSAADRSQGGGVHWLAAVPLHGAFVEGNGETLGGDRGTGAGATWNCAEDADISDAVAECVQNWPRRFGTGKGVRVVEPDGFNGKTSFDVTDDVMDGVSAWVIRLERGSSAAHHSREAADELDDPSLAPTLILTPVRETTAQGK